MDNSKQKSRSLIMCTTPLQMLIAEKIIQLNRHKSFDLLVLALNDNEKYSHYYNRLSKICLDNLYYIPKEGLIGFFDFIKNLKKSHLSKKYKEIYLASIDSRHFQYVLSKNNLSKVFTFDDGTANIISSSLYYANKELPKLKKVIWRVIGVKYDMSDVKKLSKTHYTIYENVPNIINEIKFVSLIPHLKLKSLVGERIVKFYLGQPLFEISEKFNNKFIENEIKKLKPHFYYPHPREEKYPKIDCEIIDSNLIFEDFILQYLMENPTSNVEVYSFISTALLNISCLPQVSVIYIKDVDLFEKYKEFYFFAKNNFNIPCISLE